jgi:broad specificity phosphatase PhoE
MEHTRMTAAATRLYLVRHGATPRTEEDRFSGADGVDLSENGRRQVRSLAERRRDESIKAVYCSPMDRAVETAALLAEPHGLVPIHRDGLREIAHGRWEADAQVHAAAMLFNDTSHYARQVPEPCRHLSKWWDPSS